ncbi:MAG: M48 family metalloprotease [Planctomycetes bacterium]|nr:M48 family metalloprotease [Planctomycetota bacterium]
MMKRWWVCVALMSAMLLGAPGCSTNPATGKSQFNVVDEKQEIQLGVQAQPAFTKDNGGEIPSPAIRSYVNDLGHRLAAASERPQLPWTFTVVDSSVINAFALPGGKVFISRGLLAKMTNEAQLAGVLGHEIGHVTAQHIGQQMSQAMVLQGVVAGLGVAGGASNNDYLRVLGMGASAGGSVYLLKFGRDQESQADELGVRYMSRLGYNPVGQLQVMEILQKEAGSSNTVEFLSTHPLPQTRLDRLNALIKKSYPDYNTTGKYRFNQDEFKAAVLDPLKTLPPPKPAPAAK